MFTVAGSMGLVPFKDGTLRFIKPDYKQGVWIVSEFATDKKPMTVEELSNSIDWSEEEQSKDKDWLCFWSYTCEDLHSVWNAKCLPNDS